MQSIAVIRALRLLPATRTCLLPLARASTATAGPADTAVHSQDPQEDDAEEAAKAAAAAEEKQRRERQPDIEAPPTTDNIPPFAPSPKLESHEVGRPGDPSFQQKRRWSHAAAPGRALLEDATCVGADGSPLAGRGDSVGSFGAQVKEEEEEEYAAYYKGHKPSPLSEIEFMDTRKPINQAWDGGARDDVGGGEGGRGLMEEDTVDAALQRAEAMFQAARERGDPDSPQSRALARMLRERARRGLEILP
ncbi:uncharacterized protein LOC103711414 [Phoenix dactylifera]|uniref:Uncharacterized protein LOC103711414 n=1 Tax=Phoenix dactylifera TaxID=42345 RepID=A0A8B7CBG5_PHODC|nr:uncharacterized protein LOC103711414 [Phoenix dactylifera]